MSISLLSFIYYLFIQRQNDKRSKGKFKFGNQSKND